MTKLQGDVVEVAGDGGYRQGKPIEQSWDAMAQRESEKELERMRRLIETNFWGTPPPLPEECDEPVVVDRSNG